MRFSTRTRYGLRFLIRLARLHDGELLRLKEVAQQEHISQGYLEQIVRALMPSGILRTVRGTCGGYCLARTPEAISLEEVFTILEGDISPVRCLTPTARCRYEKHCVSRQFWNELDNHIRLFLRQRTLAAITNQDSGVNAVRGKPLAASRDSRERTRELESGSQPFLNIEHQQTRRRNRSRKVARPRPGHRPGFIVGSIRE